MSNNINQLSLIGPDESLVLKYFSLPENTRNELMIAALKEKAQNLISVIEKEYDEDMSFSVINDYIFSQYEYEFYANFVGLFSKKGLIHENYNVTRLELQQKIAETMQKSGFLSAIKKKIDSWSESQQRTAKDFLNNMRMNGCNNNDEKSVQVPELRNEIENLEDDMRKYLQKDVKYKEEFYNKLEKLLKNRLKLAKLLNCDNFAEMSLKDGFKYNTPENVINLLNGMNYPKEAIDSPLHQSLSNVSIKDLEEKTLEYVKELTGLEAIKTKSISCDEVQTFEIKKEGQRIAWLSFIDVNNGAPGSTSPLRLYRKIGDTSYIPDVVFLIYKKKDEANNEIVNVEIARTVLHEMGHSLLYILAHNDCPDYNAPITEDSQEFYSCLFEGLLQDFLESKHKMVFEKNIPLRNQLYTSQEIEYCKDLIEMHKLNSDEEIEKLVNNWCEIEKWINDTINPSYCVNRHCYITGAALAERWIMEFRDKYKGNYLNYLMNWFTDLCEKGKKADADNLFKIL